MKKRSTRGHGALNLQVIRLSKARAQVGDIFVLKPKGHPFYFGRVICDRTSVAGDDLENPLVYLFKATSESKSLIPHLNKHQLLVPPVVTNWLPWELGYFEVVSRAALSEADVLRVH